MDPTVNLVVVAAVREYRVAVGERTRDVVAALRPEAWDEILGVDQLGGTAIRHNAGHIGEAVTIHALAGFGLGI
jgi:hypothetical protein